MTNNKTPDDATGDGVTLARVHTFFAALLTFLGLGHVPDATVLGMLDELTRWLEMAKAIRRDPQGATARIWWDAFKLAREFDPVTSRVAHAADEYTAEFGKRFLPVAEEDRDTFDTADFEALRTECDRLDANIAILESRADDLQQNLDSIIAERDALLRANKHHASENDALRAKLSECWAEIEYRGDIFDKFAGEIRETLGISNMVDVKTNTAIVDIVAERDELKRKLANAIVPLPKPERVAPGQRWLWQTYEPKFLLPKRAVAEQKERNKRGHLSRIGITSNPLHDDNWIYLGTENA